MKKIRLETLTPIILDEDQKEKVNYSNYENLLDNIINNDEFCNIALTGAYGAGKSTIMNTYEKEHNLKAIHISLAKLNNEETDNVQAKLINQIIHQIDPKLIPQTRFKIKKIVRKAKVFLITLLLFVFIASVIYLLNIPKFQMVSNSEKSLYDSFWKYKENIIALGIGLISSFSLLLYIINAQMKRPLIKSIRMDKSQIELVEGENNKGDEKEIFDKYTDEIIYLFENGKINVLVIEDMDRMNDVKIFYELRQINFLINRKLNQKGTKKVIRFIYMIKDEVFKKSEERTKFFDIIVPIVPVMDNSNSYELLKRMMGDEWLANLDKSYLKMICMYIRDYRVLKNIFNEFQVYYSQLCIKNHGYEAMKLFAMVTYKNLWPSDFAELQQGKGSVAFALDAIHELRKNCFDKISEEIEELEEEASKMNKELACKVDELDALYLQGILYSGNEIPGCYIIDEKMEYTFDNRSDFIHALKNANKITWRRESYPREVSISKTAIQERFDELNDNDEYVVRKERLLESSKYGTSRIEQKIRELQDKQKNVKVAGIKELTVNGLPKSISDLFPADKELIKIFIQDEMITSDYASYMTYFYPYSITNEELRYLNRVFSRVNDDEQINIEITHPDLVIEYIKSEDWGSIALPNRSLYMYLVETKNINLSKAVINLKTHSNLNFAVEMLQAYKGKSNMNIWVNALADEWDGVIEDIIRSSVGAQGNILDIIINIVGCLDLQKIPLQVVSDYLHAVEDELISRCNLFFIDVLDKINYRFSDISVIPNSLIEKVYTQNLYQLSDKNIYYLLKNYHYIVDDIDICTNNYSLIMKNNKSPLAKYVMDNIERYLEYVYVPYYATYSEEIEVIIDFLNDSDISEEIKCQLVAKMRVLIEDIECINQSKIRNEIVKNKKMKFVNSNILFVWKDGEIITEELCDYLEYNYRNNTCDLSFAFIKKYFDETNGEHPKAIKLISQLLKLEWGQDSYRNLVKDVNVQFNALTSIGWNDEQLETIVRTCIIGMTEINLKLMRKIQNKELYFTWILNQVQSYLILMRKVELRKDEELHMLISCDEVIDTDKIKCISMCSNKLHVKDKYNTQVVEEILKSKLFDGDFVPIIRRYNSKRYGKRFMDKLGGYMINYISHLIEMSYELPYDLLINIIKNDSVTIANKKKLLAAQVQYHNFEQIKECLKVCDLVTFLNAFEGQNPKVDENEENKLLIESMITQNWLSSFKLIGSKYIIYPKKVIRPKLE